MKSSAAGERSEVPGTELRYTYIAKGKYWRFRHPTTGDLPLPGTPGDADFHNRYAELVETVKRRKAIAAPPRTSLRWLIARYKESPQFRSRADATQVDYTRILDLLIAEMGDEPFALITPGMIRDLRDEHADRPRKANKIKQIASLLYSWADEYQHVPSGFNPAQSVRKIRSKGGPREYVCWSSHEFDLFMDGAIEPMRTAAMLARYTGQRASDIVRMVWSDLQGDMIRVRQNKTGAPLMIACPAPLRAYLDSLKQGRSSVVILTNAKGSPYISNSLSTAIGREVRAVKGMPIDRSIHGLRYLAGADLEEAGCTVGQIQSVLGHHAYQMAMKYATQRLRSVEAAAKRDRNEA